MFDPRKLKVCFLAGTLGRGGSERQLVYMLRALNENGVATRVLCLTKGEPFEQEITELGIAVEHVAESGSSRFSKLRRIVQSLRREPTDIIQSVHFYTNLYAAVAARITGAKEIGALRSNLEFDLRDSRILGRFQLKLPRHHITNSATAREQAIASGISPNRIDLIPNVVQLNGNRVSNHRSNGAVRLLFVGRLTEEKRADRFLRVVSTVIRESPGINVKALVVGDGPLRPRIEELATNLGLVGKVEMLGECADMSSIYGQADLLLLTSDLEGTPNVVLEAMGHGLPVAATSVGGVPAIVSEDRGFLCDPHDERGLAEAAVRLVRDKELRHRFGQVGRDYVRRFHSQSGLHEQLLKVYKKVLYV